MSSTNGDDGRVSLGRPAGAPGGDAQSQIAATLSRGPRGLPQHVSNGIATLASRMASDDVLLSRLRFVVATESLGIRGGSASQPRALSESSTSGPSPQQRGPPHRISDGPASPTSPTAGWDVLPAHGVAENAPAAPAGEAAGVDSESSDSADARAVEELRQVFSQGVFVRSADSSSSAVDVSTSSNGAAPSSASEAPAAPMRALSASKSPQLRPAVVEAPPPPVPPLRVKHTVHRRRDSMSQPRAPDSPPMPDGLDPVVDFDPEALVVSARFLHSEHPSAFASLGNRRTPTSYDDGDGDTGSLPAGSEPASRFPSPQRASAFDDASAAAAEDRLEAGAVAGLWEAIYSSLFVPVDGAAAADGAEEEPTKEATPAKQRVAAQPHLQQVEATDERFLIAAAMLVNSAMLWVLIQKARGGNGGTAVCGVSDIVGTVADVVQRSFSVASGGPAS
jgi:hypothetical protein